MGARPSPGQGPRRARSMWPPPPDQAVTLEVRRRCCEAPKPVPAPPTSIQPPPPAPPPALPYSVPSAHTHWEPGAAGPPGAEPLGIGSGWRARALWGEDERAVSTPTEHRLPLPPHCAYLWLWGSPKDSGLFSPSGVWGGWWAPGAGTEVAGSLVALQGDHGVTVKDALTSQVLSEPPSGGRSCRSEHTPCPL